MVMRNDRAYQVEVAKRRAEAVKLRIAGATYQQIADSDLYPEGAHRAAPFMDVQRALQQHLAELHADVNLLRQEDLLRLDRLNLAMWQRAIGGDVRAAELVLKIIERRSKLLGTDAPQRHTWESESDIDRAIRDLREQLDQRAELDEPGRQDSGAVEAGGAPATSPTGD